MEVGDTESSPSIGQTLKNLQKKRVNGYESFSTVKEDKLKHDCQDWSKETYHGTSMTYDRYMNTFRYVWRKSSEYTY
jgi:hypothetical protein